MLNKEGNVEPPNRIRRNPRLPFIAAGVVAVLLLLFSLFREMGVMGTWKLYRTHLSILSENAKLREENQRLQQEVEKLKTNASYIEEIARKELGLVREKENVIVLDRRRETPTSDNEGKGAARP